MAGPLDGIRIIDLTAMVSGPLATALLADQGARVIKVERPGTGDPLRAIGVSRGGISAIFSSVNRSKDSIVLNLAEEDGRALLERLVEGADVFIQNFRPGVVERMGIAEPDLRRIRPDLIYVSISGFGETGPYAQRKVYDSVMQALSGMASSQADAETGEPRLVHNIVCDKATALTAAQAITAALLARERGGGGQHVRLNMLDASIAFLWPDVMQSHTYLGEGASAPVMRGGYLSARRTLDGFMTISLIANSEFQGLCRVLECPELLEDARFTELSGRLRHSDELGEILDSLTSKLGNAELSERLTEADVPHAPVNRLESLHEDPQVIANGTLVELDHPVSGRSRSPRPVAEFSATPAEIRHAAPELGADGTKLLAELGLGQAEIAALRERGILG